MRFLITVCGLVGLMAGCELAKLTRPSPRFEADSSIVRLTDPETGATFCSGTVVSRRYVVTAAHCVIRASLFGAPLDESIVITSRYGTIRAVAKVATASQQTDQAVLEGDFSAFAKRKLVTDPTRDLRMLEPGNNLMSCGYPLGGDLFCTPFTALGHEDFWIAGHSNLFPGMSGGPVINAATGEQVAINSAVTHDLSLVVPTLEVLTHAEQQGL